MSIRHILSDPTKKAPRFLEIARKFSLKSGYEQIFGKLASSISSDTPLRELTIRAFKELNSEHLRRVLVNFVMKVNVFYFRYRKKTERKEGICQPYTILISPTMRCNLKCKGCYAGNYSKGDDLPLPVIKRIIREGKQIGTFLYTILGGEPFIREDLFEVYAENPDCVFQVFTNSTLLNDKNVKKLLEVKNVVPVLSIEGIGCATDERRGKGTFQKIKEGMKRLKTAGILFGFSSMVTSQNFEAVISDEFFDFLIKGGAYFGWYFLFMPVGKDADTAFMPTPEQRVRLGRIVRRVREEKPIIAMDFWNDAPFVGGCIAGGRKFIHITHKGEVEPCIFIHYSTDNIKEKSLLECLKSPFFTEMRKRQPFSDNLLRPCQIIDRPHILREICKLTNPKPDNEGAKILLNDLSPALDRYAAEIKDLYDPIWSNDFAWAHGQAQRVIHERKITVPE